MNYYILQQDPRIEDQPFILSCPDGFDSIEFCEGKLLKDSNIPLKFKLPPGSGNFRGGIIDGIATLFHDILRDELIRLGIDNIQYFPVDLEEDNGEIEEGYNLVNIIGLIDAVDRNESVFEIGKHGNIDHLFSFKIDPKKVFNFRIFRIVGAPKLIIVDESLKNALKSTVDPPGVWMYPTEAYDGWM